jgi:hypothetical protein
MKTVILSFGDMATQVEKELVPYLNDLVSSEDDEVLFAIAEELGTVFEYLTDKTIFIRILEDLARSDETVVRNRAAESLTTICGKLGDA